MLQHRWLLKTPCEKEARRKTQDTFPELSRHCQGTGADQRLWDKRERLQEGRDCSVRVGVEARKTFGNQMVLMIAQLCKCTQYHQTV